MLSDRRSVTNVHSVLRDCFTTKVGSSDIWELPAVVSQFPMPSLWQGERLPCLEASVEGLSPVDTRHPPARSHHLSPQCTVLAVLWSCHCGAISLGD